MVGGNGWSEGYIADIGYTHGYYGEMNPALLAYALLLKGHRPPPTDDFTYCELGFGQGVSLAVHAAAHPGGSFWGTDFNPEHAAFARDLVEAAGLPNVRLFDKSFAEFAEMETPEFDYICLHGIYSWVSEKNRRVIVDFIRRRLKVGGAVYISYNYLPGWAPSMPVRRLLVQHAATGTGDLTQRIEGAIGFIEALTEAGAAYFASSPEALGRMDRIKDMSRSYLAHEYFNRDWNPFYFADVAQELAEAKLSYAASAHVANHLDVLNLTDDAQELLAGIGDPLLRETARDFFLSTQFRRDIFVKGRLTLSEPEQAILLRATRFALTRPADEVPMRPTFSIGEVTLQDEVYKPVLAALSQGPRTVEEMLREGPTADLGFQRVVQACTVLVGMAVAHPCLPHRGEARESEAARATAAYNTVVLDRSRFCDDLQYLSSPLTGGGIHTDRFTRMALSARRAAADPVEFGWQVISSQSQCLVRDGETLETEEENRAELAARMAEHTPEHDRVLTNLGIRLPYPSPSPSPSG